MVFLELIYQHYGCYMAKHPAPFLLLPILTTIISTAGLFNFYSGDDSWDIYSPDNGLSRLEAKALERYQYASGAGYYRLQILVSRKDGGNLMNNNDVKELLEIDKRVTDNITITDGISYYNYHSVCGIYCSDDNNIALSFIQAIIDTNGESASLQFTYPNARALQKHLFLGHSVGDLHRFKEDESLVDGFKLFILHYMVNLDIQNGRRVAKNFESQLRVMFASSTVESQSLDYAVLSSDRQMEEQGKITLVALPFLGVTGVVLVGFMIISLINFPIQKSQHIEAIFAVFSPLMALFTCAGILWGIGFPYSNILTVVPFLVVTIGVDDAFLILAAWRHSNPTSDLATRIGETLARSGASVTVTSMTDVLCFAVGLFSNLPVVRLFSLYTAVALIIDFIYQMTFFAAVVVYCARRQMRHTDKKQYYMQHDSKKIHHRVCQKVVQTNSNRVYSVGVNITNYNSSNSNSPPKKSSRHWKKNQTALQQFINFLHLPFTKFAVVAAFVVHIIVSSYLCTKANTNFDLENLYLKNSPMNAISRKMQRFILREAYIVYFGLFPMPNFADVFVRDKFDRLIEELETIPSFGMGPDGTVLWTKDFADAVAFWGEENDFWKQDKLLGAFREYEMDERFITTEILGDGIEVISGFFWLITYHNLNDFLDVQKLMQLRRSIIGKYATLFNVSSYNNLEKVPTESAASAPANFIQTAVSAIILMTVLVYLFISDFYAVISVVISILSICLGTLAYLHLWDVNLDAVSLISMLMSVGFSVDYSAHICYHYFIQKNNGDTKAGELYRYLTSIIVGLKMDDKKSSTTLSTDSISNFDTRARLLATFNGVGWPVIQAGLSTMLGMIPMTVVQAYVVAVFWKAVMLVTVLGMIHALILLPVMFLIFNDFKCYIKRICVD